MDRSKSSKLLDLRTYRSFEQTMRAIVHPAESENPIMDLESAEEYLRYAKRLDAGRVNFRSIQWDKVKAVSETVKLQDVPENDPAPCVPRSSFPKCPEDLNLTHEMLRKLVVLKLNGGLGTTMGCKGSKSAIEVRDELSFLDMTIRQVEFLNSKYGVDVPLILMNSFNTHAETVRATSMYKHHNLKIHHFEQHMFPKANKKTFLPIPTGPFTPATKDLWYPPGHGDVYAALADSGLLEQFVKEGKEYVFISNIDNLGATVDLDILYELMCNDWTFCMEVTTKQRQDVTGGILVEYEGKHRVLEKASMSKIIEKSSSSQSRMMFNTNNIWVGLRNLQSLVSTKALEMEVLVREKPVTHGDDQHISLQLTCASGGAMEFFDKPIAVHVNRQRFLPVKTTSDLFGVQSNLFTVKHGSLTLNPSRVLKPTVPTVKLGPCFQTVEEYQKRLENGVPDILELEHLTVSGDVHFGSDVTLKGTVIIVAEEGSHIDIASGSTLRDNVITGNLRIMEH